jgi:lysine-specific demethylase 8
MSIARGHVIPISRISADQWNTLVQRGDVGRKPLLVSEAFSSTDAVKTWTPQSVGERFADTKVSVAVDLPLRGTPYDTTAHGHRRDMTMREFTRYLPRHPGSYLAQARMPRFPGLADDLGIVSAVVPPVIGENLWIGNGTRSGLHFDMADGLLAQVYGVKTATLVEPGHFANVYPYPDAHSKSRVDPSELDERAFPRFAEIDRFAATLTPGDALYIPRLWWHHLVSDEISVSVNSWFGRVRMRDLPVTVLRAGPAVWRQAGHDFVSLGILKREHRQRIFAKPTGLWLYETFTKRARR